MDVKELVSELDDAEYELDALKRLEKMLDNPKGDGTINLSVHIDAPGSSDWSRVIPGVTIDQIKNLVSDRVAEKTKEVDGLQAMLSEIEMRAREVLDEMMPEEYSDHGC